MPHCLLVALPIGIWDIQVGVGADGNHPLTLLASANFANERVVAKEEKSEEKIKLDKEFKDRQTKLNEKLAAEKQFANWIYTVADYVCDPVLKPRSELLAEAPKPPSGSKCSEATGSVADVIFKSKLYRMASLQIPKHDRYAGFPDKCFQRRPS